MRGACPKQGQAGRWDCWDQRMLCTDTPYWGEPRMQYVIAIIGITMYMRACVSINAHADTHLQENDEVF